MTVVAVLAGWCALSVAGGLLAGRLFRSANARNETDFVDLVTGLMDSAHAVGRLSVATPAETERRHIAEVAAEGSFTPHYQPIVTLTDGDQIGVEALTRFADSASPEHVFKRAADLGVGLELELATLRAAITDAVHLGTGGFIAVNVSPRLLVHTMALREVLAMADRPVVVELSEQEAIGDYARISVALAELGLGTRLSVDDAGSGFASLRHILLLRPTYVKFDRTWVDGLCGDPARQALIAGLRHFAESIDAVLIAEGIEQPADRQALIDLGVTYGQGYLLGRPAPVADRVVDLVESGRAQQVEDVHRPRVHDLAGVGHAEPFHDRA